MFGRLFGMNRKSSPVDLLLLPEVQQLFHEDIEHQLLINLDTREVRHLGSGDEDGVFVAPMMYRMHAAEMNAKRVVLVHNHPPGEDGKVDYRPSEDDLRLTAQVLESLAKKNIELVDHLVVSLAGVYSYKFRRRLHTRHASLSGTKEVNSHEEKDNVYRLRRQLHGVQRGDSSR